VILELCNTSSRLGMRKEFKDQITKKRYSLFLAVSCENGFFGAKKVTESLYKV
jgi:hypothetical protein